MRDEELQSKISGLLGKLPSGFSAEIIEDNKELPESSAELQRPGPALPDELIAMITNAFKDAAEEVFGQGAVEVQATQISPMDDSTEAREAVQAMLGRMMPRRPQCYHYILNKQGQPVHCEDGEKIREFQEGKGHILAEDRFAYRDLKMRITTAFMVHNSMIGSEPPAPHWITQLVMEDTDEIGSQELAHSADEAMLHHRTACEAMRRQLAEHQRQRRPSPLRRLASGLNDLRRKRGQR